MVRSPGFFSVLFDFSFTKWVTVRLAAVVYALAMVVGGILAMAVVGLGLAQSLPIGIVSLIVAALGFLMWVVAIRLGLEAMVVLSRIAEQTEEIAEQVAGIAVDASVGPAPSPESQRMIATSHGESPLYTPPVGS